MATPADRGHIATEQSHDKTCHFDALSTLQCVDLLANDHEQAIKAVQNASPSIASFIEALVPRIEDGGRLIYFGCGTSGRLGVLDASECPPTFRSEPELVVGLIAGGDKSLRTSSEAKEDDPNGILPEFNRIALSSKDTVIGIAAGGTTPWVLGGLKLAKQRGSRTCFLTCSEIAPKVDHLISLQTGAEPLTGSTRLKAGTATKLTLNIITTTLFTKLGKVYGNLMVDVKASNDKLFDRAIRIVSSVCEVDRETSATLLANSGGEVKVSIVMHKNQTSAESAKQKLAAARGNLRKVLQAKV